MPQIFGCPNCQNPFQVPDDAAGQAFQCPNCHSTVEVPAAEEPSPPPSTETEIFACPYCTGRFGIDASMYGQQLACPHCKELVEIGEAPTEAPKPSAPQPDSALDFPVVNDSVREETQFESIVTTRESATEPDEEQNAESENSFEGDDQSAPRPSEEVEEPIPPPEPVFEPQPVDHILPPRFDVPDPARFPSRLGAAEVILPDGEGGYQSVDANIVTITHNGEVYHLKRLTPEQRRRRNTIHNSIAIAIAVLLIYLTLRTLGLLA